MTINPYLINLLAIFGFITVYCVIAGYIGYRVNKYLDNILIETNKH
jgi:hypothetical protein